MQAGLKGFLIAALTMLVLFSVSELKPVYGANDEVQPSLSMPEEYVNYTISRVDGVLWAKIDGIYPILYTGSEKSMHMVYPTPPETTNISLFLDNIELDWDNFTEVYPYGLHHTAIGDWQMISAVFDPFSGYFEVRGYFVLRIHYEHPVQVINGSYVFLYDLNIKDYLSDSANRSVVHYTIYMDTEYTNLNVYTVFGEEETLKPIAFTSSGENPVVIRIDEVSEFGKPLPGDLLVSFSEPSETDSNLWVVFSILVVGFVVVVLVVVGLFWRRRNRELR